MSLLERMVFFYWRDWYFTTREIDILLVSGEAGGGAGLERLLFGRLFGRALLHHEQRHLRA